MHRVYAGLGWGIMALGLAHIAASTRFYSGLAGRASLSELVIVVGLFGGATALAMLPGVLPGRDAV